MASLFPPESAIPNELVWDQGDFSSSCSSASGGADSVLAKRVLTVRQKRGLIQVNALNETGMVVYDPVIMKETKQRSIIKAGTYRLLATIATFSLALIFVLVVLPHFTQYASG